MPYRWYLALAALPLATPAPAAPGEWGFSFNQGIAEYSITNAAGDRLSLSCAESGIAPGSRSIMLERVGYQPRGSIPAVVSTDRGRVTVGLGQDGWATYPSPQRAARFTELWKLLAKGGSVRVIYGPGKPIVFSNLKAQEMLGGEVCPRQLAD